MLAGLILPMLFGLTGCSSLRLGYSQADALAYWQLDHYLDFTAAQTAAVKPALSQWREWHRTRWLAEDVALLEQAAREVSANATAEQVCRWRSKFLSRQEIYLNQAVEPLVDVLSHLSEAQFRHLQDRLNRSNSEWRDENLRGNAEQIQRESVKRVVKRAELLYDAVDAAQRRFIGEQLIGSPWNAQRWLQERERQQRDITETLHTLGQPGLDRERRVALLRAGVGRIATPTDEAARQYREQVASSQCELAAALHNRTDANQRRHAAERLQGWAQDLRSAGAAATGSAAGSER